MTDAKRQTLTLCLMIITSALHLYLITRKEGASFHHAVNEGAGSVVVFCLSMIVIWPVAALLSYHFRVRISLYRNYVSVDAVAHESIYSSSS